MQVICSCNKARVDAEAVQFLNIEEGPSGEDRMQFVCPYCGEDHTSVVLAGEHQHDFEAAFAQAALIDQAYADAEATAESACQCYE